MLHVDSYPSQILLCSKEGEFDYNLGDDWECMSIDDQANRLKYLQGDVLGLKQLSERFNQSCYEKFCVNL